jgi:hypothetical protein
MADGGGGARDLGGQGESLRKAMRWLDERARDDPRSDRLKLVSEAASRFDLSPLEEDFLVSNWVRAR